MHDARRSSPCRRSGPASGGRRAAGDTLIVDYTGVRSATGEMFDSSYLRGVPLDFVLGRGGVIAGWDQGLAGMQAGSVVKLDVPSDLAYGNAPPSDDIQPGDALDVHGRGARRGAAGHRRRRAARPARRHRRRAPRRSASSTSRVGDGATVEAGDTAVVHMLLVRGDNLKVLLDTWKRSDPLQVVDRRGPEPARA